MAIEQIEVRAHYDLDAWTREYRRLLPLDEAALRREYDELQREAMRLYYRRPGNAMPGKSSTLATELLRIASGPPLLSCRELLGSSPVTQAALVGMAG